MSPALLDAGAPPLSIPHSCYSTNATNLIDGQLSSHSLSAPSCYYCGYYLLPSKISQSEQRQVVQNFLVLLETSMNPSNFGDLYHEFSIPTRNSNQDFNFNHPRSSSSSSSSSSNKSGLSRPRLAKHRRHLNSLNLKSNEESCVGSGFNPFPPVSSEIKMGSSGSIEFVSGGGRSNVGVSLYSGKGIVEQMGSGNVSSKSNVNVGDKSGFVFGSDHSVEESMKKLSIDEKEKGVEGGSKLSANEEAKFRVESGDNVGCSFRTNAESVLPDELKKKLNIGGTKDFDGGSSTFKKVSYISVESSENALPDRIKNLNIKESIDTNNVNNRGTQKGNFLFGSRESTSGHVGEESESTLSSEMGYKLNIGNAEGQSLGHTDMGCSSSRILGKDMPTGNKVDMNLHDFGFTVPKEFVFKGEMQGTDANCTRVTIDQSKVDTHPIGVSGPSGVLPSSSLASGNAFTAPPIGGLEKTNGFSFTNKQDGVGSPFVEFKTPNPKSNVFTGVNLKPEFNTQFKESKVKKKRGKLKQPMKVPLWLGQDFVSRESGYQETEGASESYSPMDISPYQETVSDPQNSRGTSVASEESFTLDNQHASTDSQSTVQNDAIDEDLVAATQRMDINEEDVKCGETEEENSQHCFDIGIGAENCPEESISGAETESFKSANEEIDSINEVMFTSVESESSSSTNIQRLDSDLRTEFFSVASSEDTVTSGFTFAAASSAQAPSKHHVKKKSWAKIGSDSFNSTTNAKGSYASSPLQFIPFSGASSSLSPSRSKKAGLSTPALVVGDNAEVLREQEIKKRSDSASIAAQESCEKWRLRGNQAYASGDLSKAEDCYTQGVNCVSRNETSRSCLRALMLCFSNRAATRMSLGRMRDALRDCEMAAAIDPNFLRVQLRAANCYLALGEVEDALQYFKKCMHSGSDVCVDRKIVVEASVGLQKAQKVFECMQHSAELLQQRLPNDALQLIAEGLLISPYSEKFLEMKAESLFTLRNYEDVIQLCEHTFDSANKNSPPLHDNYCIENLDSELTKDTSFMIWRCRLLFKSYFYLGRLEEAIGSLEKQQELHSVTNLSRNGSVTQESLAPLVVTVRELLHHKATGNEAFQAGKHSKAIEHYTAALSRNIESRPFAAICFCNRAAAYKALGQITDAVADCSLAIALDGNYFKAISRRATLYEMIRDYGQAANDLQRLVDVITKQVEQNTNQFGHCDRTINLTNDLRQARLRLSTVEEEGRKNIPLNMYLILGIESSASASEIKKAYRKAALRHHPDKAGQSLARSDNGDDGLWKEIGEEVQKDADRLFKMIGEAYAVLSDPDKRLEYDLNEVARNDPKNHNGSSTIRRQAETHNYPFERSNTRRQWRDVWKTCGSRPGSRYG